MKRTLYSICIGTVLLALTATGAPSDRDEVRGKKRGSDKSSDATVSARSRTNVNAGHRGMQKRSMTRANVQNRSNFKARTSSDAVVRRNFARRDSNRVARSENLKNFRERNNVVTSRERRLTARNDVAVNRERNFTTRRALRAQNDEVAVDRTRGFNRNRNRNIEVNRHRNITVTNNWRGERFSGRHYAAFHNYNRQWHHRDWWRHHHTRIVFVLGGAYYWNAGYWYPAWGYDPGYTYVYDGPIYGYNDLSPDQVVVNVQAQLRADGYYDGPIDGQLGPMTRQAIAAFQADNGLAVTAAVDEPTLATLGLT